MTPDELASRLDPPLPRAEAARARAQLAADITAYGNACARAALEEVCRRMCHHCNDPGMTWHVDDRGNPCHLSDGRILNCYALATRCLIDKEAKP